MKKRTDKTNATHETSKDPFREWVILELMGHRRLAGLLSEVELAGEGMWRIDVPGEPAATQFYNPKAVYAITPTTEGIARAFAKREKPAPVSRWELPQLEGPHAEEAIEAEDLDDQGDV